MLNETGKRDRHSSYVANDMRSEYLRARSKVPRFRSYHEGLAIMLEEFEELKAEVFLKNADPEKIRAEALQVGAMAIAFFCDLPLSSTSELGRR